MGVERKVGDYEAENSLGLFRQLSQRVVLWLVPGLQHQTDKTDLAAGGRGHPEGQIQDTSPLAPALPSVKGRIRIGPGATVSPTLHAL